MALRSSSQELADVFDPNTWLVDIQYNSSAKKPKAPVTSADSREKQKQAVTSARARYIILLG
jgi:hypothetical protein